jgi:hypothetical protein
MFIGGISDQVNMYSPYIYQCTNGIILEYAKVLTINEPKFVFNTGSDLIIQTPDTPEFTGYSTNDTHVVIRSPWFESSGTKDNFVHLGKDANTISAQNIIISDPYIIVGHNITGFVEIDGATDVVIERPNISTNSTATLTNLVTNNTFGSVVKHIEVINPRGKLSTVTNMVGGADTKVSVIYSKESTTDLQGVQYDGTGYRFVPTGGATDTVDIEVYNGSSWNTFCTLDVGNSTLLTVAGVSIGCASSLWSNEPLKLGSYTLWVDSTGDLRIVSGSPASDTDGAIVGTQS